MKETYLAWIGLCGRLVVAGSLAAGAVMRSAAAEPAPAGTLSEPSRLEADGSPIDIEFGGAAPFYGDFDGDGLADLLVGQADGGKLRIYRNRGAKERPRFDGFEWFKAGAAGDAGQVLPGPQMVGGVSGFVPQLVDFDGDGLEDVLSCTGNGGTVIFRRQKDGQFAEGETLKRADGLEIVGMPGAAVHAADWDGDGDLDLIIVSNQRGEISLLRKTGGSDHPIYGGAEPFKVAGDPIQVGAGTSPVLADWDADGRVDLLVGFDDGTVAFFRNVGTADEAELAERVVLVRSAVVFDEEDTGEGRQPGQHARPCVCDFNGDGRLDLMVGSDWFSVVTPELELTDEERAHDIGLEKKLSALSKKFSALRKTAADETTATREERLSQLRVISNQMRGLRRELTRPPYKPIVTSHGCVWVYLRRKMD